MGADKVNEVTVLVNSCDRYRDLWPVFAELWRKYWPDCPFETVLMTESETETEGVEKAVFGRVLACGRECWSKMIAKALKEIDTPYVMMLCDDYLLADKVDTARIMKRLEEMKRHQALNLRLIPNPKGGKRFGETDLMEYEKNTAYCVATQAGFWDKEFLAELAGKVKSIWEFERYGSFAVKGERPLLHTATKEFPFVDAVHKGYWEKFGKALVEKEGIKYDFAKRGLPSLSVRLREGLKSAIFNLVPTTPLVKLQNAFGWGWKEKRR